LKAVRQEKREKEDGSKTFLQKSKEYLTKRYSAHAICVIFKRNLSFEIHFISFGDKLKLFKFKLLTKAFQSLSEKKSKMETSFQADKKSIVVSKPASFSSLLLDCIHPYLVNIVSFFYKQLSCLACLAEK